MSASAQSEQFEMRALMDAASTLARWPLARCRLEADREIDSLRGRLSSGYAPTLDRIAERATDDALFRILVAYSPRSTVLKRSVRRLRTLTILIARLEWRAVHPGGHEA